MAKKQSTTTPDSTPAQAPAPTPAEPKTKGPAEVMLNWKQARLLVVHPAQSGSMLSKLGDANATLTPAQVAEQLEEHKPLTILPGIHSYPSALWDGTKNHPAIQALLRDEQLVVVTNELVGMKGEKAEPAAALPDTLNEVSASNARELAEGCLDAAVLKRWTEAEKVGPNRATVLDALKAQTELLEETDKRFKGEN